MSSLDESSDDPQKIDAADRKGSGIFQSSEFQIHLGNKIHYLTTYPKLSKKRSSLSSAG